MKYRGEIDGLRALAVVPVILFHAGFELFSGGFVGVDVFFVISGYLITTLLIEDIENNNFSIVRFYKRRAQRILPALFFVVLACVPPASLLMMPGQLKDFSQSLVAVSLFGSNVLFWQESGYFDTAAEEKPLLHTWSLAVEEQYYVLFPIFLLLAWRFGKNKVFWAIVLSATISLILSEWAWRNSPVANFYLAPTRAWELFAGSIAAFIVQKHGVQKSNVLSLMGLAGIVFSIFAYDATTPFPSVYALVPVLGVVLLVLFADQRTVAAKLLSTKGFVGIGLISYSAYLWHQPLFAFARIYYSEFSELVAISLAIGSIFLAYLSWRFIEMPFRRPIYSTKNVLYLSLVSLIVPLMIGAFFIKWIDANAPPMSRMPGSDCEGFIAYGSASCVRFDTEKPSLHAVIWGDSHSLALRSNVSIPENITVTSIGHSGCAPIIGVYRFDNIGNFYNCSDSTITLSYADYINSLKPDVIILTGRWGLYLNGWMRRGVLQNQHHFLTDSAENSQLVSESDSFRKKLISDKLLQTVKYLEANTVSILISPPDLADTGINQRLLRLGSVQKEAISRYNGPVDQLIQSLDDIDVWDSRNYFCSEDKCELSRDGFPLYDDENHVSYLGSGIIWQELLKNKLVYLRDAATEKGRHNQPVLENNL